MTGLVKNIYPLSFQVLSLELKVSNTLSSWLYKRNQWLRSPSPSNSQPSLWSTEYPPIFEDQDFKSGRNLTDQWSLLSLARETNNLFWTLSGKRSHHLGRCRGSKICSKPSWRNVISPWTHGDVGWYWGRLLLEHTEERQVQQQKWTFTRCTHPPMPSTTTSMVAD